MGKALNLCEPISFADRMKRTIEKRERQAGETEQAAHLRAGCVPARGMGTLTPQLASWLQSHALSNSLCILLGNTWGSFPSLPALQIISHFNCVICLLNSLTQVFSFQGFFRQHSNGCIKIHSCDWRAGCRVLHGCACGPHGQPVRGPLLPQVHPMPGALLCGPRCSLCGALQPQFASYDGLLV